MNKQSSYKQKRCLICILNFNGFYKATIIKTVWQFHKNRHTDQWIRIKSLEIEPYKYSQLIFTKEQQQFNRVRVLFLANSTGTEHPLAKK